jgi:NAD(P)-dependent dehydrogenase (short-subunit alcohol dehydrogenase family)
MGRKALPIKADLTDEKQVIKTVKDTVDFFGKLDILVNNVGGTIKDTSKLIDEYVASQSDSVSLTSYMRFSPGAWDYLYNLNLKTHVMMCNAVTPYFIKQRSGKIVNISSISARMADPYNMPYSAMKAADISITWSIARALAPYNITVNCICPGFVYTPLAERGVATRLKALREEQRKGEKLQPPFNRFAEADLNNISYKEFWLKYQVIPVTPLGREQTTEDMGKAVVFFVSEDAKNITGQVLHVDGGAIMR